ncbi:hypothetical protein Fleli_1806 [Bernardetia litoralis DSM 6794]|uniref:Methyltransferase domain-containing protein n=1 Tax=Bernardetia litoralis (strain ATCC 23117 / DSM 6794 / NBRC 15988 / NCIMB 1366 / Fx l1 / Sio-4) TaxID=880071 RepID=I4AJR9_BERLS|nr:hypothetical protein [Bernardetia litoralis]AFM04204.1 hypothetical protein Fleli_1806 [Bernardetia litoralis DSM 6794]
MTNEEYKKYVKNEIEKTTTNVITAILQSNINMFKEDETIKKILTPDIFKYLKSGKDIIDGDEIIPYPFGDNGKISFVSHAITPHHKCISYVAAYGAGHLHRLLYLINKFFEETVNIGKEKTLTKKVDIIDFGCGQGLATLSFLHTLQLKGNPIEVSNIILIEPSKYAIDRASINIQLAIEKYGLKSKISLLNKRIDEVDAIIIDSYCEPKNSNINLFGHVIDAIDDNQLIGDIVMNMYRGHDVYSNYIIAVNTTSDDNKLRDFKNDFWERNYLVSNFFRKFLGDKQTFDIERRVRKVRNTPISGNFLLTSIYYNTSKSDESI